MTLASSADLLTALIAGLAGSLHCIGMCGPLAAIGCRSSLFKSSLSGPLFFVLGKLLSYSVLGLLAGLLGSVIVGSGLLGRATAIVSLAGGAMMLAVILWSRVRRSTSVSSPLVALTKFAMRAGKSAPLLLGISAALLPCGLLYAMVARSAASGESISGMMLMQAFGLGTTPALLGLGAMMRWIPQRWSRFGNLAGEIVLALSGAILIWRGVAGLMAAPETAPPCCG
jgi:sulfite exporter TauE/SafE